MFDTAMNGHAGRNTLLLLAVAAGCGWLLYMRAGDPAAIARTARDVGRNLRGRLNGAGLLAEPALEHFRGRRQPARVAQRRLSVSEPMAGYGA